MSAFSWKNLLLPMESINAMDLNRLEAVRQSSDAYLHHLAHGISGIGTLLASTAGNSETGLNADAVANVGWMLESLGGLISNLSDTTAHADHQIDKIKRTKRTKLS